MMFVSTCCSALLFCRVRTTAVVNYFRTLVIVHAANSQSQVGWKIVPTTVLAGLALATGGTEGRLLAAAATTKRAEASVAAADDEASASTTDGSPKGSCSNEVLSCAVYPSICPSRLSLASRVLKERANESDSHLQFCSVLFC